LWQHHIETRLVKISEGGSCKVTIFIVNVTWNHHVKEGVCTRVLLEAVDGAVVARSTRS